MNFDSSLAWNEAVAAVKANRQVLLPVAGVFFLLPGILGGFFLSDYQEAVMASLSNPGGKNAAMATMSGPEAMISLLSLLLQMVGTIALLALLTDRQRPTVGEAIGTGLRALPTLIGALLLCVVGYFLVGMIFAIVAAVLGGAMAMTAGAAGAAGVGFLAILMAFPMVIYVTVKLSLLPPVVAIEREMNPVAAIKRSWKLTRRNSLRLFFFYLLLFIAYLVVALIVGGVIGAIVRLTTEGAAEKLAMGVLSGLLGAAATLVFIAILAAVHGQLTGTSADRISETFE